MLAKINSKNQLTLPKKIIEEMGAPDYFDVRIENGCIVLKPILIQRADAVRVKLEALGMTENDVAAAVVRARKQK